MANKQGAKAYAQEMNAIKEVCQREVEAITIRLREKDETVAVRLKEKDEAHRREVEAIKGQLEEKDERIKEKDRRLQHIENESLDVLTSLRDVVKGTTHQKRGEYCFNTHQFNSLTTSPYQVA
jgi:bisphosphoglycerate-dependent phosphoglycerate mutase